MSREGMAPVPNVPTPTRCFCRIELDQLTGWARKKYLDHLPTIQLLALAKNPGEREAVAIVALLDVPDEEIVRMMTPLSLAGCNILACRDHVKRWLSDMLAMHPVAPGVTP